MATNPHSASSRVSKHLMLSVCILLTAVVLFFSVIESSGRNQSPSQPDQTVISRIYNYRNLVTRYDSVVVGCMFGEMFIPQYGGTQDSLQIEWVNSFPSSSVDSTEAFINSITQSKPFRIASTTDLTLFRMILMRYEDESANYSVPDTTAWIMELWDHATKTKLATIDSVGICKATNLDPSQFPTTFGHFTAEAWESLTISLGTYAGSGVDSVYILLKSLNWDTPGKEYCSVFDDMKINQKFSETIGISKRTKSDAQPVASQCKLFSFPNPSKISGTIYLKISLPSEQHISISLFDNTGKHISAVFTGSRDAGVFMLPYQPRNLSPGTYILRAQGSDGSMLATHKLVILK